MQTWKSELKTEHTNNRFDCWSCALKDLAKEDQRRELFSSYTTIGRHFDLRWVESASCRAKKQPATATPGQAAFATE